MHNKKLAVLFALRGAANKGGGSKWNTASKVMARLISRKETPFGRGEMNTILKNLAKAGLVETRTIANPKPTGRQGRLPKFEFAVTPSGRDEVNAFIALAR